MQELIDLLRGPLSPTVRIWSAAAPALVVVGYFVLGLLVYVVRGRKHGAFRDAELAGRGSSVLIGMAVRHYFAWVTQPIWLLLRAYKVPAMALTTLSALLATAAALSVAVGRFALGGWIYVAAGLCDFFDGRVARASGTAGPWGAALDSVLDRYSDTALLLGLAWYYRQSWVLLPVELLILGTFLVPYVRARGEGLGVSVTVGLMQRPERMLYLGVAIALSPILEALHDPRVAHPPHILAALAITVIGLTTLVTAGQRFVFLLRALSAGRARLLRFQGDDAARVLPLLRFTLYSTLATIADIVVVLALVGRAGWSPWGATMAGCVFGGLVNVTVNRYLAFGGRALAPQRSVRYGFVSASSALLNGGGVALLLSLPGLDYRLAWALSRFAVLLAWNYPLSRDYLFALGRGAEAEAAAAGGSAAGGSEGEPL
ncbi:MAG: GtrA family protein [Proteobacteria bacterium]|nr:GtrA family protein [Pseudomonadota bacterium]